MTRAAIWLLAAGVLLFAGVLISQGLTAGKRVVVQGAELIEQIR